MTTPAHLVGISEPMKKAVLRLADSPDGVGPVRGKAGFGLINRRLVTQAGPSTFRLTTEGWEAAERFRDEGLSS